MKSKELIFASIAIAAAGQGAQARDSRPNILFIITDQQSYDMVQAISGNKYIATPGIDRLVSKGYSFANCYVANPVSVPSRFALLTGESPAQYGFRGNDIPPGLRERIVSLATGRAMGTLFKNAGYETFYGGKVHVPFGDPRGFKKVGSSDDNTKTYGFDTYLTDDFRDVLCDTGVKFLREHKSEKPFLLCLSFINPHDICSATAYLDRQFQDSPPGNNEALEVVKTYERLADKQPDRFFDGDGSAPLPGNMAIPEGYYNCDSRAKGWSTVSDSQWRRYIWVYHNLVEFVDREIGLVLDALEKSPYAGNTYIIFTSDHGEMGGAHHLTGKSMFFNECQKVPFIFVGKGIKNKIDRTTPVCNGWDLLPTMCDMAGIPVPKQLRGMSLWNTITKGTPIKRDYLYLESAWGFEILQQGRYKFSQCEDMKEGRYEILFDLEKDPMELNNVIADPAYKAKADELRSVLEREIASRDMKFYTILDNRSDIGRGPAARRPESRGAAGKRPNARPANAGRRPAPATNP